MGSRGKCGSCPSCDNVRDSHGGVADAGFHVANRTVVFEQELSFGKHSATLLRRPPPTYLLNGMIRRINLRAEPAAVLIEIDHAPIKEHEHSDE